MSNSQRLAHVRNLITEWFREHGHPEVDRIDDSILIRDGFYCGRRFTVGDCTAVWFIEPDQIKLFDAENQLLASLSSAATQMPQRRAA
jgi:hypothetical protein